MRTRWILATSILLLMLVPGALRAADQAPLAASAAAVAATPAQPVNALPVLDRTLPDPSFMQAPQEESATPLFLVAPCTGCTGVSCTRLHSCVLNHCC